MTSGLDGGRLWLGRQIRGKRKGRKYGEDRRCGLHNPQTCIDGSVSPRKISERIHRFSLCQSSQCWPSSDRVHLLAWLESVLVRELAQVSLLEGGAPITSRYRQDRLAEKEPSHFIRPSEESRSGVDVILPQAPGWSFSHMTCFITGIKGSWCPGPTAPEATTPDDGLEKVCRTLGSGTVMYVMYFRHYLQVYRSVSET